MSREAVWQSFAVRSCSRSVSPLHNDAHIRAPPPSPPPQEERRPAEDRRASNAGVTVTTEPDSAETEGAERSACRSEPRPPPPQHHYAPPRRRLPTERSLSLGNGLSHTPLLSNNRSALQNRPPRAKQRKAKISGAKNSQNRKVTDFYPIRRSSRKSKTELKCEQKKLIDDLITDGIEEGMKIQQIEGKGRAVFATRRFHKGEYVVEYHGDLLEITDAKKREAEYAQNPETGCYMYYFQYLCKTYCVDATKETGRMGRLINHSKSGNCQTKLHDIGGVPHLILVASRDIHEGEELLYDYGDRSKASIAAHPWLKH